MRTNFIEKVATSVLWTRNFWHLCLANLLVSSAMYMLIPIIPFWCEQHGIHAHLHVMLFTAVAGFSFWMLGPVCSYLLDRFKRRNVCVYFSLCAVMLTLAFSDSMHFTLVSLVLLRAVQGMAYGMVEMSLGSGLVIDLTSSVRRNDGNFAYNGFGRLALSLGPFLGVLLFRLFNFDVVLMVSLCMGLVGCLLILSLHVPFRAPLDPPVFSSDRFWLKSGKWHFLVLLLNCAAVGCLLILHPILQFYGLIMVGLMLALLASKVMFAHADPRAEAVSGMILLIAVYLLLLFRPLSQLSVVVPVFTGLGIGLSTSRILLCLLRKANHCERGCANTTYLIAWECGLSLGIAAAILFYRNITLCYVLALTGVVLSLIIYIIYHKKNIAL